MPKLTLYRAITPRDGEYILNHPYKTTQRPPTNVPYVVDNLWEWQRPEEMPCRRLAAYASPTPESALDSVSGPGKKAFRIEFTGACKLAQLKKYADSKEHPECSSLKKLLISAMERDWPGLPLDQKQSAGQLWMPCLSKSEVNTLFETDQRLLTIKDKMIAAIQYWQGVELLTLESERLPDPGGEIFFEALDGYRLVDEN
ncbi:MAG: hypothetical protein ACOZBW_10055 [Thermodesulfobacteriota bacterium]